MKRMYNGNIFLVFIQFGILCLLTNCQVPSSKIESSLQNDTVASIGSNEHSSENRSSSPVDNSKWEYNEKDNKMTSDKIYTASLNANEELQFDFPYQGGATATIYVRNKEKKNTIALLISTGQFNSTYDGQNIRMKFDADKPIIVNCSGSSDSDPKVLFIRNGSNILNKLKKASKVIIEAEFFNEGVRQMEFDTKGFKWNY